VSTAVNKIMVKKCLISGRIVGWAIMGIIFQTNTELNVTLPIAKISAPIL